MITLINLQMQVHCDTYANGRFQCFYLIQIRISVKNKILLKLTSDRISSIGVSTNSQCVGMISRNYDESVTLCCQINSTLDGFIKLNQFCECPVPIVRMMCVICLIKNLIKFNCCFYNVIFLIATKTVYFSLQC